MPASRPDRDRAAADLWRAGHTYREIADRVGLTPGSVAALMRRLRASGIDLEPRKAPLWTEAEDARLVSDVGADREPRVPGRTADAVRKRLRILVAAGTLPPGALAPPPSRWTPELDGRLIEGYGAGRTLAELAADLRQTSDAVFARVEQLRGAGADLPARKPRWTDDEQARLARRYREGATYRQLSIEFGRAHGSISRQLKQLRERGADLERRPAGSPPTSDPS